MTAPIIAPSVPLLLPIPGAFLDGMMIRMNGVVKSSAKEFAVNLQCGASVNPRDDLALHFNPRFGGRQVICNSLTNQYWGPEHLTGDFPFELDERFEILLLADSTSYMVAVNGRHFTEFPFRMAAEHVTHVSVDGDVSISMVNFEGGKQQVVAPTAPPYLAGIPNPALVPTPLDLGQHQVGWAPSMAVPYPDAPSSGHYSPMAVPYPNAPSSGHYSTSTVPYPDAPTGGHYSTSTVPYPYGPSGGHYGTSTVPYPVAPPGPGGHYSTVPNPDAPSGNFSMPPYPPGNHCAPVDYNQHYQPHAGMHCHDYRSPAGSQHHGAHSSSKGLAGFLDKAVSGVIGGLVGSKNHYGANHGAGFGGANMGAPNMGLTYLNHKAAKKQYKAQHKAQKNAMKYAPLAAGLGLGTSLFK